MNDARPAPARTRLPLAPLALACTLALAACGAEPEDTAPLSESSQDDIIGTEPVEDHEPGQSPDAINDPADEPPQLLNKTPPDQETDIEIGADEI